MLIKKLQTVICSQFPIRLHLTDMIEMIKMIEIMPQNVLRVLKRCKNFKSQTSGKKKKNRKKKIESVCRWEDLFIFSKKAQVGLPIGQWAYPLICL